MYRLTGDEPPPTGGLTKMRSNAYIRVSLLTATDMSVVASRIGQDQEDNYAFHLLMGHPDLESCVTKS